MNRRTTAVLAAVAATALLVAPADALAKKKGKPRPVALTQYLNWAGDCAGTGYLSLKHTPNADSCALFFPQLTSTYYFGGAEGLPIALDAQQPINVDFTMFTIASAAADFDVTLSATIGGERVELGTATETVTASAMGDVPVYLEIQPPASLDMAKITGLNLEISWRNNGVTYSEVDLDSGSARLVIRGFK